MTLHNGIENTIKKIENKLTTKIWKQIQRERSVDTKSLMHKRSWYVQRTEKK